MMRAIIVAIACAVMVAANAHAQTAPTDPTASGFWAQSDDNGEVRSWFLFAEKDGVYSGRIVKIFKKPGEPVYTHCPKCPGDLKGARMLGLTLVNGMKRDGLNYTDGSVLDPRDGSVYHAEMSVSPDGQKLFLRGYVLVPLLGQTQTWNRLPDDVIAPDDVPKEVLATPAPKP